MKVEYLVLINSKEEFCKSVSSLNNLIQSYDGVVLVDGAIQYKECKFDYSVQLGYPENTEHRFFHINMCNTKKAQSNQFQEFLKLIRTILSKISGQPVEVLNDDLSSSRCITAYPIIHKIENKMRKLITKFMLTNIGFGWSKDKTPKEVKDSLKSTKTKNTNFLYEVDFIQLSKFLFNNYASVDSNKIIEKIKGASSVNDLDLSELREFVPQSNWDRYFATIVDCSNDFLEKRWQRLYDIRNKIAHNRFITEDELDELKVLAQEVDEKLQSAIDNLDQIHISDEQKEEVAENVAVTRDEWYAKFLSSWNILLETLHRVAVLVAPPEKLDKLGNNKNWRGLSNIVLNHDSIPRKFKTELMEIATFRNTLVHHTDVIFTEESIIERIEILLKLYDLLKNVEKEIAEKVASEEEVVAE
jgi:uncharacterized protein YutE (UPF0331/DUF86 family)